MKTLVDAIRRNADVYDAPRKAQTDAENGSFRSKFASAFGSRPAGMPPDGENPLRDNTEQGNRKAARGKGGKR